MTEQKFGVQATNLTNASEKEERGKANIALLFLFALLANAVFVLKSAIELPWLSRDEEANCKVTARGINEFIPVMSSERRFSKFKEWCQSQKQLGYATDDEKVLVVNHRSLVDMSSLKKMVLAQYALAPTVIMHDDSTSAKSEHAPEYILVDLYKTPAATFFEQRNFSMIKDFGDGAYICRRREGK